MWRQINANKTEFFYVNHNIWEPQRTKRAFQCMVPMLDCDWEVERQTKPFYTIFPWLIALSGNSFVDIVLSDFRGPPVDCLLLWIERRLCGFSMLEWFTANGNCYEWLLMKYLWVLVFKNETWMLLQKDRILDVFLATRQI